jgi:hypothetical protein
MVLAEKSQIRNVLHELSAVMGQHGFPYDLVAVYGQIALGVLSLLIAILYKESQKLVMSSDWGKASFCRRMLWIAVPCFLILALLILITVILQPMVSRNNLMSNSSGVSTLLVAVITVFLFAASESCRVRDILDLRVSEIDVARITALTEEGNDEAGRSMWRTVRRAMFDFRQTREVLALTKEIVGLTSFQLRHPHLKPSFQLPKDVIDSCKAPPLLLKSTDYQSVSLMVRPYTWKIVCACETSHQEFYATIRLLQNRYKNRNRPSLLHSYSNLLAKLEKGGGTILSEHYLNQLKVFRVKKALENADEADVIIQWIYNSPKLRDGLRSWDSIFKFEVQDMLAVCPRSSGYWEVVDKLAKVNDRDEFNALYMEMTSEESMKVVFILYALKSLENSRSVLHVTEFRKGFMANCKKHVKDNMKDLFGLQFSTSARNLADIAMLTFLRVRRGWEEKSERLPVLKVYPNHEELKALELLREKKVFESADEDAEKNEDSNVHKKTYVSDKSAEDDEMKEDSNEGELSEPPAVFDSV